MKKNYLMALLALSSAALSAQDSTGCSTPLPTAQQFAEYQKSVVQSRIDETYRNATINGSNDFVFLPLTVHLVRTSGGSGGSTQANFEEALARLNSIYVPAGVQFFICGNINYINNDNMYSFELNTDLYLLQPHLVSKTFNVFIVNDVTASNVPNCGFASYADNLDNNDYSVLKSTCLTGTTLEHEMAHSFGVLHTHDAVTPELVARPGGKKTSNCGTAGDMFCDTPADPNISSWTTDNYCEVTKNTNPTDSQGDKYVPDGKNIMSYAPTKTCRTVFSAEQYAFIRSVARTHYDWTKKTCSSSLKADFNVQGEVAVAGHQANIFDQTMGIGINSHAWTFSGANISNSTAINPTVVFANPGLYNVSLTVANANGSNQVSKNVKVVQPITLPYVQNFEAGNSFLDSVGTYVGKYAALAVNAIAGKSGNGLSFAGSLSASGPTYVHAQNDEKPFICNPNFISRLTFPSIDATNFTNLKLTFDKKMMYNTWFTYGFFRVLVNGAPISSSYKIFSDAEELWATEMFDLSAYDGTVFDLTFEGIGRYADAGTYMDNLVITGTDISTGLTKISNNDLLLFPNPSSSEINLTVNANSVIKVYNSIGELVYQENVQGGLLTIDVSGLSSGVYIVKAIGESEEINSRFVKR